MSIFKSYDEAFKAAQDRADLYQADQGVEKLGTSFHVFQLAPEGKRFGYEARCQVVRPMLLRPVVLDFHAWGQTLKERPWMERAGGFRAWFDEVMAAGPTSLRAWSDVCDLLYPGGRAAVRWRSLAVPAGAS